MISSVAPMLSSLRVEHAVLDAESRRNAAFSSVRNSPGALAFIGGRGLLTATRCDERALSIDQFGDLSIDQINASKVNQPPVRLGPT